MSRHLRHFDPFSEFRNLFFVASSQLLLFYPVLRRTATTPLLHRTDVLGSAHCDHGPWPLLENRTMMTTALIITVSVLVLFVGNGMAWVAVSPRRWRQCGPQPQRGQCCPSAATNRIGTTTNDPNTGVDLFAHTADDGSNAARSDGEDGADKNDQQSGPVDSNDNSKNNDNDELRRRARVAGVSVSSSGFWVVLQCGKNEFLPLQVTDDPTQDGASASSPQALTILQLLASVDMAGAILPPDLLARMTVLSCEELVAKDKDDEDSDPSLAASAGATDVEREIVEEVQTKLFLFGNVTTKGDGVETSSSTTSYSEQHEFPWMRSRIPLPQVTLDEVFVEIGQGNGDGGSCNPDLSRQPQRYTLRCSAKHIGKVSFAPTESIVEQVSYEYRPGGVSMAFTAVALALRYKAPIVIVEKGEGGGGASPSPSSKATPVCTLGQIEDKFPMYKTTSQLQQMTQRVHKNIERGFEVNQLQAALRLAREKGDDRAAAKIRVALDEMDSLSDLPTQPETDIGSMQ